MKTTFKTVEYSYSSSPNSNRFKFKNGCFTVEIIKGAKPPIAIKAFDKKEDAIKYAETLHYSWHWLFLKYNQVTSLSTKNV